MAKNYDFQKDLGAKHAVKQCWHLSKQDYKYYIIGVGFTILGASLLWLSAPLRLGSLVMPYYSVQFSMTVNIFNSPPAVLDPLSRNWPPA